jgi:hypothetical protein
MIQILITLIIVAVLVGLLWWVCDYLPVPEPLNKILKFAGVVIAVIVVVVLLMGLAGYDTGFTGPRRITP